jgi:hypothetical protein
MKVRSIRRITADGNHNAFTGAQWFKGALYVAFRQGDAHVCENGKLVVMRSRDGGIHFDTVAILRGEYDTRDAHLYTDGNCLFLTGFEYNPGAFSAGVAWTENGINWSQWNRCVGTEQFIMWRPRYFKGSHYCAGYDASCTENHGRVCWFTSPDGVLWKKIRVLREGADSPNECALDIKPNGDAAILMRREHKSRKPLLLQSHPPYERWTETELDIPLGGPALWFVHNDIWISGRWFPRADVAHLAVFKIVKGQAILQMVLPSGPGFDCSYMGVARHPENPCRFAMSYYSNHVASEDPSVSQWDHPDIYLADACFASNFIENWKVSELQSVRLEKAACPDLNDRRLQWVEMTCGHEGDRSNAPGFVDAHERIAKRNGVIYFAADLEVGPCDHGYLYLGYDGPIRVWVNGKQVFEGPGDNPAEPDKTRVSLDLKHGHNRVMIALDTHEGKAWGIYARFEPAQTA